MATNNASKPGLAVDASGAPAFDPTPNVLLLVDAANRRQDDLRVETNKRIDAELNCLKTVLDLRSEHLEEITQLRADHMQEMRGAESARLDAIRQVDREDVSKTAVAAQTAISVQGTTTAVLAETLRNQVASVAAASETRRAADNQEIIKRLSALELSSSEGKGKQAYVDPQMAQLTKVVEELARAQSLGSGKKEGISDVWKFVIGAAGLAAVLFGSGFMKPSSTAPQVVYVPPAGSAAVSPVPK